ncbi:hypothetical protein XA68_11764 [Ophiocordyceps unilateralis]|uniref:Uncharacterized protein n=1 Tax=Ophiocordyceps unilateralis TaxID=268505 RepID=A0A2A9PG33_OPHUN|nr:hypothetical protein XA68_11764 [Ophiocordyceps unilateralis]
MAAVSSKAPIQRFQSQCADVVLRLTMGGDPQVALIRLGSRTDEVDDICDVLKVGTVPPNRSERGGPARLWLAPSPGTSLAVARSLKKAPFREEPSKIRSRAAAEPRGASFKLPSCRGDP